MDRQELRLRTDGVAWRELEGEVVVLDTQRSEYFGINRTGSVLWQALATGTRRPDMVDLLVERYGLAASDAAAHVERFTEDLQARGLLEPA